MKVLLLLLGLATAEVLTADTSNAISRVVKLMREFSEKLDSEIKSEKMMCKKFDCWCQNTVKTCNHNIEDSTATKKELEAEAEGLGASRSGGSFSLDADWQESEAEDLTGDRAASLALKKKSTKETEDEKNRRKEERALYEKNHNIKSETLKGIHSAAKKICEGRSEDNNGGCDKKVSDQSDKLGENDHMDIKENATGLLQTTGPFDLDDAVTASFRVLMDQYGNEDPADYAKLSILLLQQDPQVGGAKKYTGHLGKINTVLNDMFDNVYEEFSAMQKQEEDNGAAAKEKMASLKEAQAAAESQFADLAEEKKAREARLEEITAQVKDLEEKIAADEDTIKTTEEDQKKGAKRCAERHEVRAKEKEGVDMAISSLNEDRNKFSNVALIQLQAECTPAIMLQNMGAKMSQSAVASGSLRLLGLASEVQHKQQQPKAGGVDMSPVFDEITKMIAMLDKEDADDQKDDDDGKKRLETASKAMRESASAGDGFLSTFRTETAESETQANAAQKASEEIDALKKALKEATEQSEERNREFLAKDEEDQQVLDALKKAYDLMNKGRDAGSQSAAIGAMQFGPGEAPPPPPKTAADENAEYKADGAGSSILTMISIIYKDVEKGKAKATEEENDAAKDFSDLREKMNTDIADTEQDKQDAKTNQGDADEAANSARSSATDHGEDVKEKITEYQEAQKGPDYLAMNFNIRKSNRASERTALMSARATLQAFAKTLALMQSTSLSMHSRIQPGLCKA